ncbi:MAG: enoyl-CoA hydratase/isomerase family protein [Gemmatimonadetes bacterium]|nr:enoyl-CoA hydratase/isomerase family protein [Gemmatimonadota bacterium]NNM04454.1 enoyl-CoA hydratase/isomerase family protein [Gemmatimonadota bacterium]
MNSGPIRVEQKEGILTLWLNRPEKRNALNGALVDALTEAFREAEGRADVRVIVLRGKGPVFCAGADLAELERYTEMGSEESLADAKRLGGLLLAMRRHPRPIIAAVHGDAFAGGCGLATACDLILASEKAVLGYPEVQLGFVPAMVMAILRKKLGEGRAFEMVAMGKGISASEAREIGLVNRVFSADEFDTGVEDLAGELAKRPPEAISLTKSLLYELADLSVAEGIARGAEVNVEARQTEACRAGVRSFLRKHGTTS